MSVLLTEGSDSCLIIGHGIGLDSGSVISFGESKVRLIAIAALASAISLLRRCSSSVVGKDVLLLRGFNCWWSMSSVISGINGQKSSIFCCAAVATCYKLSFILTPTRPTGSDHRLTDDPENPEEPGTSAAPESTGAITCPRCGVRPPQICCADSRPNPIALRGPTDEPPKIPQGSVPQL